MERRQFIGSLVALTASSTAGCVSSSLAGRSDETGTTTTRYDPPLDWTRSTDCDGMHDNVIKVEWVRSSLGDEYSPIQFSELSDEEKELLRSVLQDGGVGTCEVTQTFRRFVERVSDHRDEQYDPGADDSSLRVVHLKYGNRYYGLYVEQGDQVFSGA